MVWDLYFKIRKFLGIGDIYFLEFAFSAHTFAIPKI